MKYIDFIEERTPKECENGNKGFSRLVEYFQLNNYCWPEPSNSVKIKWIDWKIDIDTDIGNRMYFVENRLVAFSFQRGRKTDEEFKWVSRHAYFETKKYLSSLLKEDFVDINVVNWDEEVPQNNRVYK